MHIYVLTIFSCIFWKANSAFVRFTSSTFSDFSSSMIFDTSTSFFFFPFLSFFLQKEDEAHDFSRSLAPIGKKRIYSLKELCDESERLINLTLPRAETSSEKYLLFAHCLVTFQFQRSLRSVRVRIVFNIRRRHC